MIYVVAVPHQKIVKQEEESSDARWFILEEVDSLETFDNVKMLVRKISANL
jgi:NADH pyrophosphatase NudC (nudix superfamily)